MSTTITRIYLPVHHANGELLIQITQPDGTFCGWADGRGKYDISGTWEVCEAWTQEQHTQFESLIAKIEGYATVTIRTDRLARIVTTTV